MGFFGYVLVNGTPQFSQSQVVVPTGSTAVAGLGFSGLAKTGLIGIGTNGVGVINAGLNTLFVGAGDVRLGSGSFLEWGSAANASGASFDTALQRIAANRIGLVGADSTTAGTMRLGTVEFSAAASTFAQTATVTNGPRAANPVHWQRVTFNNGGSSGRVPIW